MHRSHEKLYVCKKRIVKFAHGWRLEKKKAILTGAMKQHQRQRQQAIRQPLQLSYDDEADLNPLISVCVSRFYI
jgi:hypothetical protein